MLTKTSCYSAVDIVVSVMVYYVETVLVDVLEQDRQACYDALVYNISSPFRHNRKPLIFQWVLTLGNAGIGSVSIPAFRSVNAH